MYTTQGEFTEWHLRPSGWERGTEVTDSSRNYKDAPDDRVMTCKYSEHMTSTLSINSNCDIQWTNGNEVIIEHLKNLYGACPFKL